jgi:hypothetical protein
MARRVTGRRELHAPLVAESERERILASYAFAPQSADVGTPQGTRDQEGAQYEGRTARPGPHPILRSTEPSRGFNVFISYARADREIAAVIDKHLSLLSSSIYVFLADFIPSGYSWSQQTADILFKTDLMFILCTGNLNENQLFEVGLFLGGSGDKNSRDPRVIPLQGSAELPSVLSRFMPIRISPDSIGEASRQLNQLAREIGKPDIRNENVPDWATRFATELADLFDRDVIEDDINFQYHLSIEIDSNIPLPGAIETAKIAAPFATARLFDLARENLAWTELLESPVLKKEPNYAWAEEIQRMLLEVLQGYEPSNAVMALFIESERRSFRSVLYRHSRTRRGIHYFQILLIELAKANASIDLFPAQGLLLLVRFRYEVLDWGLKCWMSGGFDSEADWEELYRRMETIEAASFEAGITDIRMWLTVFERRGVAELLRDSFENNYELVELARGRSGRGKEYRERLLLTLRKSMSVSARLISELALSIGVTVEAGGSH